MTSSERQFSSIGVIGLGTMGAGIAEVFARNGYSVTGVELSDEAVARGREHLEHSTSRAVKRGKMSEAEKKELLDRITLSTSIADLAQADFVVDSVIRSSSSFCSASLILPRFTARDVECSRCSRPRATASSVSSTPVTE